jgi:starch synthase
MGAIREAVAAFRDRERWTAMMREGMSRDYSWDLAAGRYSELYNSLTR